MIFVDEQIERWIQIGNIIIDPFDPSLINPNSLDLRLGNTFIRYHPGDVIDPYDKKSISRSIEPITADQIYIRPEDFVLGTTLEKITLPDNVVGAVEGKSGLARLGLETHQTGGWIDAGFSGNITLEFKNNNRSAILLRAGMPISQIVFHMTQPARIPYWKKSTSKYQNQTGATISRYHLNKKLF